MTGQVEIECKLHVDGEFSGQINSTSLITVGKSGVLEGEVVAKKLVVTGQFSGVADCEEIEILANGRMQGQITSKILVIERGSFFQGESRLKDALAPEGGKVATLPLPTDLNKDRVAIT